MREIVMAENCLMHRSMVRSTLNEPFTIVFPEQIDYLASSFIQGSLEKFILKSDVRNGENFDVIAPKISNPKKPFWIV